MEDQIKDLLKNMELTSKHENMIKEFKRDFRSIQDDFSKMKNRLTNLKKKGLKMA